jgi:prepilin-type N-terminal cleavage/methylation domain-containing protein
MTSIQKNMRGQAGFTLVEWAIVMIIIGLLIAGVLKGQALITNAQVTAVVAQAKAIDAATTSFKDAYSVIPGDMPTPPGPGLRLPNCTGVCAYATGNGDGVLTGALPGAAPTLEEQHFFPQLGAAGLLTGINATAVACTGVWGADCYPTARIGGGFEAAGAPGGAALTQEVGTPVVAGIGAGTYLVLTDTANAAMSNVAGALPITANEAMRVDTKVDDGVPTTGVVLAGGNAACVTGAGGTATYAEAIAAKNCGLFIKIQN